MVTPTRLDPNHSLYHHAWIEADRHKWIESEKHRCDLGIRAIKDWRDHYWRNYCRARMIEHLSGKRYWEEMGQEDFDILNKDIHPRKELVNRIAEMIGSGYENLDIILWAVQNQENTDDVIEILNTIDINAHRLDFDISQRI